MSLILLVLLNDPYNQAYYAGLVVLFVQTSLYCFCGELVATKAEDVAMAIYCSKWYEIRNIEDRKLLITVLARAQEPCYFDVGGLAPFNMETLTNVSYTKN